MATRAALTDAAPAGSEGRALLAGRRIVVTGVLTDRSLAYHAAERMQQLGAEVVLTSFGRARRLTERAARMLPAVPEVVELDVLKPEDFEALSTLAADRWDRVDGILHSIAFAPREVFESPFFEVPHDGLDLTMRTSVYSLAGIAGALLPQLRESPGGASIVGLTVSADRALVHSYAWVGIAKAALNSLARQMAAELAADGIRINMIASGPVRTNAASAIPAFDELKRVYGDRAPLGWDSHDVTAIAGPACFLLSELAEHITGVLLHVDGGRHAVL